MKPEPRRSGIHFELEPRERPGLIARHLVRWSFLVILSMLTYLAFPVPRGFEPTGIGEVAPDEIIAPFQFDVMKSTDRLDLEKDRWEAAVRPVYEYREDLLDSVRAFANELFGALDSAVSPEQVIEVARVFGLRDRDLTPDEIDRLITPADRRALRRAVSLMIERHLSLGVPSIEFAETETSPEIMVRRGDSERLVSRDSVFDFDRFMQARTSVQPDAGSTVGEQLFSAFLQTLFRETLVANVAETDSLRQEARDGVDPIRYTVRQDERIVDANEVVTEEIFARLSALRGQQLARGHTETDLPGTVGQILTNALVLALFWVLLMVYLPGTYASFRQMLVLTVLFAIVIIGAAANVMYLPGVFPELIPIPFAAMLVTILFGGRLAMVSALVLGLLVGPQAAYSGANALFIAVVGGVAAALSVRALRRRTQLLVSVVVVAGAYFLVSLAVGLRQEPELVNLGSFAMRTAALGGLNALISAALVTITLPLFESLTGITTELTLLELSDPNRPLLRRLATEAPGTYAHSVALANLCEAACNAIGANGLLARVGCYYHDVGKLKKPQFFVENQAPGANPHDKLKPEVSASVIRNHVKEGVALANEHRIPREVAAFIDEHHGTMEISYFLDRARTKNGEAEIEPGQYRYPGPRPRTVETAVAMLADGVEAALRVLKDASKENVREAIDHLVEQRVQAGQLDDAPLTMAQLTRVRREFARVFEGAHHNRIDYPSTTGGLSAGWDATSDT